MKNYIIRKLRLLFSGATPPATGEMTVTDAEHGGETQKADGFTLADRHLIALIELMDRRIASLEGEVWLLSSRLEENTEAGLSA